ncbi:5-formyltetrahydrofolate cyclo-ligase [Sulfurimonas sp. MAG313]|nr:5-formyltetrahydrofolate cyclo-ligase [Sulfurimonas sp. MAG313]MDF1879774.1 5-formyltetrahydrofolate cyclo-ligase [Sulfurimonas sp. MAG313]
MSIDKASFRKLCMKKLKNTSAHNRKYKEYAVQRKLKKVLDEINASSMLFYLPLKTEVNLNKLLQYEKRNIKKCYVPFMVGESFKMVPYRQPLNVGRFGVSEPNNSNKKIKNVDVAIVPVLGVDADARRVGFGKGMYDRFFPTLAKTPITIFVQLEQCLCDEKITDDYDIQADIYITPKEILYRKNNVKSDSSRRWYSHR